MTAAAEREVALARVLSVTPDALTWEQKNLLWAIDTAQELFARLRPFRGFADQHASIRLTSVNAPHAELWDVTFLGKWRSGLDAVAVWEVTVKVDDTSLDWVNRRGGGVLTLRDGIPQFRSGIFLAESTG